MAVFIKCPKCHEEIEVNIANSVSEDGEVYRCPKCGWYYRYVTR